MAAAAEPFPGIPNLVFDKTIKMVLPHSNREVSISLPAIGCPATTIISPRVLPMCSEKTGTLEAYIKNVMLGRN